MLTAASVMISALSWSGTSMMKQWLIRRPVRSPVSRATTALISSSVCRLPFISASARPSRTSATALRGVMAVRGVDDLNSPQVDRRRRPRPSRSCPSADQDRGDQLHLLRLDRAFERDLVARMRDRRDSGAVLLRQLDQAPEFRVFLVGGRHHRSPRVRSPSPA
jgi:hypothetical protein